MIQHENKNFFGRSFLNKKVKRPKKRSKSLGWFCAKFSAVLRLMNNFFVKIILLTLFSLLLFSTIALAQNNNNPKDEIRFSIAPPLFEPELKRGQTFENKILIENKNDFLLPIEISLSNFDARDEFGAIKFEKGEGADWFEIENPNFILQPNERKWINFKIKIPEDAKEGCYYVSMIFKPKLPSTYFKENQSRVIPNLTSLFLIGVGSRGKVSFEVLDIEASKNLNKTFLGKIFKEDILSESSFISFEARVKNNGICHIKPSGAFEVFNKKGKLIGKIDIKPTTVLPQKTRKISFEFKPSFYNQAKRYLPDFLASFLARNLYFGKYKAVLNLHGSFYIEKEMKIFIFPWKTLIIFVLILLTLIFVFYKIIKICPKTVLGQIDRGQSSDNLKKILTTKNKRNKLLKKKNGRKNLKLKRSE